MEKILNFIKLRVVEILGLAVVATGIFIFYSIITYSPGNPTIIFPESADGRALLIKYGANFSDFVLQAFGLVAFGLCANFIAWGGKLGFEKKIASPWFQFLFIVLYLIFGSLFFKIYNDQSFWLPDNGNGGFLGAYVLKFLSMLKDQFKIIAFASLALMLFFLF
jgi:DNA segregation ATPase FtsK/SpoIIIE, S-DNA-T family